jgi:hypothetical protein
MLYTIVARIATLVAGVKGYTRSVRPFADTG